MARRRLDVKLLLASLGIAAGIVFIVWGLSVSVTGDEAQRLPEAIESIEPVRDATQVPSQTAVFVDLLPGYDAALTIDDVQLPTVRLDEITTPPGEQVDLPPVAIFEPGNVTIRYTPSEGGPIEEFTPGRHTATIVYWKVEEGPERARSYTWTFNTV